MRSVKSFLPDESSDGQMTEVAVGSEITLDQLEEVHIRKHPAKAHRVSIRRRKL